MYYIKLVSASATVVVDVKGRKVDTSANSSRDDESLIILLLLFRLLSQFMLCSVTQDFSTY